MDGTKRGAVAVIFISRRNGADAAGYAAASAEMAAEAARQPGYLGIDAVRDAAGEGITVSYWRDEAAALAWRAHGRHAPIRARGRGDWYDRYEVIVATIDRDYRWARRALAASGALSGDQPTGAIMADPDSKPDETTGAEVVNIAPPVPPETPSTSVTTGPEPDEAVIESTSVQGAPEDE